MIKLKYVFKCLNCQERILVPDEVYEDGFKGLSLEHLAEKLIELKNADKRSFPIHVCREDTGYIESGRTEFLGVRIGEKPRASSYGSRCVSVGGNFAGTIITGNNNIV